ncbi:SE1832 family protein [Salinicoccus carnicancri]|uniref:SE1832 family protein n=1 Tax=Salinicoccus carnicancri TaxID=558170 RepID=UPI0002F44595|nr:SE1832 family protein [Salinicoccus carnicancri]
MDLDYKLLELKNEYVRIQGDLEKLESTGNNTSKMEERLAVIEQEISETKAALRNQK